MALSKIPFHLLVVFLALAFLLFPPRAGATVTLDQGPGWIQVVNDDVVYQYNFRETFSVNRNTYKIRGGDFDGTEVGDTILFLVRVEDYFAWDCGWWYVYGGGDNVTIRVTDPTGSVWSLGNVTTPIGTGVTGTANLSSYTAADFGGHFGLYYANFSGNNTAAVNFSVIGEPRVNVELLSSVEPGTNFVIAANITDYNGTGVSGLDVDAKDVRTGQNWDLNDDGNGNYSITTAQISGAGDHVIRIIAHENVSKYVLDGNGVGKVSVNTTFYGGELFGLPFFAQLSASLANLLYGFPFYLILGLGFVVVGRGRVLQSLLILVNGGRMRG